MWPHGEECSEKRNGVHQDRVTPRVTSFALLPYLLLEKTPSKHTPFNTFPPVPPSARSQPKK